MCVQTKSITIELKVWVWQRQRGLGTSLSPCRHVTIVLSFQKVAGYYRQSCPQPVLGLNAFIFPIYSYRLSASCDRRLHARSILEQNDWVGNLKEVSSPSRALKSWLWKTLMTLSRDWFSWWSSSTRPSPSSPWFWCLWRSLARYCCRSSRALWASTTSTNSHPTVISRRFRLQKLLLGCKTS